MSKFRRYTQESREEILKAITNQSTSKQAWSFSRQKRFNMPSQNCPYISYNAKASTLSDRKTSFGSSRRKVFTQVSQGPCSWIYKPDEKHKATTISFGHGRQQIIANSYITRDPLNNPGPGRYDFLQSSKQGYTMRPKTANHRNYFIDDKQMQSVPGPGKYDDETSKMTGKNMISKFKSAVLGGTMTSKTKRFIESKTKTPSVWDYNKGNYLFMGKSTCSTKIGSANRKSFIDQATRNSYTPGPGNYRLPTQFAHYKKIIPYL